MTGPDAPMIPHYVIPNHPFRPTGYGGPALAMPPVELIHWSHRVDLKMR